MQPATRYEVHYLFLNCCKKQSRNTTHIGPTRPETKGNKQKERDGTKTPKNKRREGNQETETN